MATFIPAYFRALTDFVTEIQPPERLIEQLLTATRLMDGGDGAGPSNGEVFAEAFFAGLGVPREELEPVFERFYAKAFPKLRPLTALRPAAPKIVEWARQQGLQVAIATNPVFPRTAIEQRMVWAGVGVDRFEYARVTSYENSHATKAQPAYYGEILHALGRNPEECLMVGDNWNWDMVECSRRSAFPVIGSPIPRTHHRRRGPCRQGQGSLDDFLDAARSGFLEESLAARTSERIAG